MSTFRVLFPLLLLETVACHPQSARSAGPASAPTDVTAQAWQLENFDQSFVNGLFHYWGGGQALSQKEDPAASDRHIAQLILPQGSAAGPGRGPNLESRAAPFLYGNFAARLKTPRCSTSKEGNIAGFFTYFNDGSDVDGDGLPDNSEIDFEWLCAEPESIYLTIWTDYDDASGGQQRVTRKINLAQGRIEYTRYAWGWGDARTQALQGLEAEPATVPTLADYDASQRFYEYGMNWSSDGITFWMKDERTQNTIILWRYQGPRERIPQRPSRLLLNTWHSASWAPEDSPDALEAPRTDLTMEIDWVKFE